MSDLHLYLRCLAASLRGQMEHRASFAMLVLGQALVVGMEFAGVWMLFQRFGQLQGWSLSQVALLFGMANTSFALAEGLGRGFDTFGTLVKSGDFDRLLLRPRGTAFQVAAQEIQLMRVGRLLPGLVALGWAISQLQMSGSDPRGLGVVGSIAGATAVFYGLFILQATLAFWTVESLEVMNTVTYGGVEVAQYPLTIYRPWVRTLFTAVVPLASTIFWPAQALFRATSATPVLLTGGLALVIGLTFLAASFRIWSLGVRHYRSTGS